MKSLSTTLTIALLLSTPCWGQNLNFGGQSESSRYLDNLQRSNTAANFKRQLIRNDTSVNNGFGVASIRSPTTSNLIGEGATVGPPPSRSATFGVGTGGPISKPFENVTSSPTISPYMNLFNDSLTSNSDLNYQTLVRPQIQQQQFNQQVVRQAQAINRRLTALSARNAYNTTGNEGVMPTGHAATFQNYSRFYPAKQSRRR